MNSQCLARITGSIRPPSPSQAGIWNETHPAFKVEAAAGCGPSNSHFGEEHDLEGV
jgi:hypothetical protein